MCLNRHLAWLMLFLSHLWQNPLTDQAPSALMTEGKEAAVLPAAGAPISAAAGVMSGAEPLQHELGVVVEAVVEVGIVQEVEATLEGVAREWLG